MNVNDHCISLPWYYHVAGKFGKVFDLEGLGKFIKLNSANIKPSTPGHLATQVPAILCQEHIEPAKPAREHGRRNSNMAARY